MLQISAAVSRVFLKDNKVSSDFRVISNFNQKWQSSYIEM
jgi:hypothetical protein